MQLQLYMASVMKPHLLKQHDFYVAQTDKRVLAQFRDMEGDADRFAEAEYQRFLAQPGDENTDTASLAEAAHDNAANFYGLLSDLRQQVILGALAGLYHQWEKELRDFIERELMYDVQKAEAIRIAWHGSITDIFDLLTQFGWDILGEPFFSLIDACRLIVNVHKHGKGRSLEELNRLYPNYLRESFGPGIRPLIPDYLDHTLLAVSEDHYTEIAAALRMFWVAFPERLYLVL